MDQILFLLKLRSYWNKYDSKKLVYISNLVIACAHLIIAILTILNLVELWMLIVWSSFVGSVFALSAGGQNVLLPKLITKKAMTSAIAYTSGIWQTSRVVGPAAAGVAVAIIGPGYSLLLTSIGYFIAGIAIFSIAVNTSSEFRDKSSSNIFKEILEGAEYVFHNKVFLGLILISFCSSTFGTSYMILLPIFANDVLNVGAQGFGAMEAAAGIGAIIGTILVIKIGPTKKNRTNYTALLRVIWTCSYSILFHYGNYFFNVKFNDCRNVSIYLFKFFNDYYSINGA